MDEVRDPPPIGRFALAAYAVGLPLAMGLLVFVPAGTWRWPPGWGLVGVLSGGWLVAALVIARVNPIIFRARSRFQPGTERWDLALVSVILVLMVAILPVSAYCATHVEPPLPLPAILLGYSLVLAGTAGATWAQAVNAYFEPGVRIQSERGQHVVSGGPYRYLRHPGYVAGIATFFGMALGLGSRWGLVPAGLAAFLLIVRTKWEDDLLLRDLPGYADYAARVRCRLLPGAW